MRVTLRASSHLCREGFDIEVTLDCMKLGCNAAQIRVNSGGSKVAQAEHLTDFARGEELLKLVGGTLQHDTLLCVCA